AERQILAEDRRARSELLPAESARAVSDLSALQVVEHHAQDVVVHDVRVEQDGANPSGPRGGGRAEREDERDQPVETALELRDRLERARAVSRAELAVQCRAPSS